MVSLTVMYPANPGTTFDWDYYLGPHLALAGKLLSPFGRLHTEVNRGVTGLPPGTPAPYYAIANLHFSSMQDLQSALAANTPALIADQRRYYSGESIVQINEVFGAA
jgi:uncharacterized protein (TIGR02118 family)